MEFLVYRGSVETDCEDVLCAGWGFNKGRTGDVLDIPVRQMPDKKENCESALNTETFSQVEVIYELSERMRLNDAREAARLALMEDQGNDDYGHSADSHEN